MFIPQYAFIGIVLMMAIVSMALGYFIGVTNIERRRRINAETHHSEFQMARMGLLDTKGVSVKAKQLELVSASQSLNCETDQDCQHVESPSVSKSWQELLKDAREVDAFAASMAFAFELDVDKYCRQLVKLAERISDDEALRDIKLLETSRSEFVAINEAWTELFTTACDHVFESLAQGDRYECDVEAIETSMLNLASQIETTAANLGSLNVAEESAKSCKQLLQETGRLFACALHFRDRIDDALAAVMRKTLLLGQLDEQHQRDNLTGARNRWSLESILHDWVENNRSENRRTSVAFIDIDGFTNVTGAVGFHRADRFLARFSRLLEELTHDNETPVQVIRFRGDQFALVVGDVGARQAIAVAERIRQTIEAATFQVDAVSLEVTVSCAVIELVDSPASDVVSSLQKAIQMAKENGQNCSCIDEGNGTELCKPPKYRIEARVVNV